MGYVRLTPEAGATKWKNRASNATQDYKDGVSRVTESPTAAAARQLDKAKLNYNAAIDSGKTARKLNAITREAWIQQTKTLGGDRYATGVAAAQGKYGRFTAAFYPFLETALAEVRAMPNTTFEQSKQRMIRMVELSHGFEMP